MVSIDEKDDHDHDNEDNNHDTPTGVPTSPIAEVRTSQLFSMLEDEKELASYFSSTPKATSGAPVVDDDNHDDEEEEKATSQMTHGHSHRNTIANIGEGTAGDEDSNNDIGDGSNKHDTGTEIVFDLKFSKMKNTNLIVYASFGSPSSMLSRQQTLNN